MGMGGRFCCFSRCSSQAAGAPASTPRPVRVILMIGDGMGLPTVAHAHYYQFGADGFKPLAMESLPVTGLAYTHATDHLVTDSAAAATALLSGCKTRNGMVGLDAQGRTAPTLVEEAKAAGLATGVVTTAPSPTPRRRRRSRMSATGKIIRASSAGCSGTGRRWPSAGAAVRNGRTFPADYAQQAGAAGYRVCRTAEELGRGRALPVMMVFDGDHHALEGSAGQASGEPRLADLATRALDLLNQDPDGFFLMVEGGIIDWANHDDILKDAVGMTLDFDRSIEAVMKVGGIPRRLGPDPPGGHGGSRDRRAGGAEPGRGEVGGRRAGGRPGGSPAAGNLCRSSPTAPRTIPPCRCPSSPRDGQRRAGGRLRQHPHPRRHPRRPAAHQKK